MKIKPKKSLGQNFLIDKNIINLIVNLGNIKKTILFLRWVREQEILLRKYYQKIQKN